MKSYKHLFEKLLDLEFLEIALYCASRGKTGRSDVQNTLENSYIILQQLAKELEEETWQPPEHDKTPVQEGAHRKQRIIEKPQFCTEQIVHHAIIRRIKTILLHHFYEYSCGCVQRKGPLLVCHKMVQWIKSLGNVPIYIAELDIKEFYKSIDVDILKAQLSKKFPDPRFLRLLFRIIDASAPGLPLGLYTSPWLGNLYLTPLDYYIIHQLHPYKYIRYMDNLFIIDTNKKHLHQIVRSIQSYCIDRLHVQIKKDWQAYRFEHLNRDGTVTGRAVNCLGFVIHYNRISLRKSILKRIRSKALRLHRKGHVSVRAAQSMVSYAGWLKHTDTYDYYRHYIKPNVNLGYCRKVISKHAKRSKEQND